MPTDPDRIGSSFRLGFAKWKNISLCIERGMEILAMLSKQEHNKISNNNKGKQKSIYILYIATL